MNDLRSRFDGDDQELVWTAPMIARFWNFESRRPENFFTYQVSAAVLQFFKRFLKPTSRIVDYGAGPGFLVEDLIAGGYQCAAVEFAPDAVQLLTQKFGGNAKFLGAFHIGEAPAQQGRFDRAFVLEVVEHLSNEELDVCLDQARGLLSAGGLLIITTPNNEDRSKSFIMSPESGKLYHRWQHVRSWTEETLRSEVCRHGFECVEIGVTDFNASLSAMKRSLSLPMRLARAIANPLYRLLSNATAPHLYMVARKA
jgi:2-polyprenyl-3-methyl-5-hydroxy-6-metoxy-1,4-benzoquinol methylase